MICMLAGSVPCLADNPSVAALHQLFDSQWDRSMREDPLNASDLGDRRYNDQWPVVSLAAIMTSHRADEQALADLARIERATLPPDEQVNYDLFEWKYRDRLESYTYHEYLFPLNQLGGIQTVGDTVQTLRFTTLKDYQDWLGRLQTFAPYMDQTIALLQQGVNERRVLPRIVADRIAPQITANIVSDPTKSEFYQPFVTLPDSISAAAAVQMRAQAQQAIAEVVIPAFKRLQIFFSSTYLPKARTALAVTTLPDGQAYYAYLVRHFTTTQMSPQQVHQLGLEKMGQIRQQMLDAMAQTGFSGDLQDFLRELRTDPKFYYGSPDELLEAYKAEAKTIDPLLVNEFGRLPRIPWGVRAIPDDLAPNTYPAYSDAPAADGSRAAYMYVNLYKPETRPKYDIPVLTCHEGRPGHALQLSLATELTNLPQFRRFEYFDAYGEGWALYSEWLCGEMGLYTDPYARFGALSYQMWRAVRLVVDTGIHAYGMSREQAVELFRANTALTEHTIGTEVDRYVAWPGQALSYMIGEIQIQQLRKRAEDELGTRFNVKEFHDVVLQGGTLPLSVLEKIVNQWIDDQGKPAPQPAPPH
jgi:uncharacterized protein (DUF885 family)